MINQNGGAALNRKSVIKVFLINFLLYQFGKKYNLLKHTIIDRKIKTKLIIINK